MTKPHLRKTIFLAAAPERVWAFLTQPEFLERWFHRSRAPLSAGERYELIKDDAPICWGKVLQAEAPRRLVYSFTHEHLGGHETRVEWTLTPVGNGTMLELIHDGFEGGDFDLFGMLADHDKGWDDHFDRMREQAKAEQTPTTATG